MNFKMKSNESGITLVALIITVIILVILAAITIKSIYQTDIVGITVNGAINYSKQSSNELNEMNQTVSFMQNAINGINGGDSGGDTDSGIDFANLSDSEKEALIGQYVAYTPISVEGGFTSEAQYSGYTSDLTFTTNTDATWRILFINSSKITLVSADVTNTGFYLQGANGYNNGVYLLNDACKTMYSNSTLGATARSLNREDIESVSSYDYTKYTNSNSSTGYYGGTKTYNYSDNGYTYYPNIFAYEKTGCVNGTYGTSLGLSDQSTTYTGYTQASTSITCTQTYYTYTMSTSYMDAVYYAMFTNQSGTSGSTSHTTYWLASRCVNLISSNAYFYVCKVRGGDVYPDDLYHSSITTSHGDYSLRPTVEITLSSVAIGATGSGTSSDPYSITAK